MRIRGRDSMTMYLLFFLLVLGINLMPAFGPPTWTIIALYALHSGLPLVALVLTGAAAAALGRLLLALGFRLIGRRLSYKRQRNLAAARVMLERRRSRVGMGLALFALSPVPSAQLFEAAGLMRVRLLGFTIAFFLGRLVSYALYASGARSLRQSSIGQAFEDALTSPMGLLVQAIAIALLILLARVDWVSRLGIRDAAPGTNS